MIAKVLVVVGGVNWGLVGLGMLLGGSGWNVVNMVLGGMPVLEGIVYVLVGLAAVISIFGCKCKKCMGESSCCSAEEKKEPVQG
jgi:uncharacterized membrane protein YuzA (DUF378 family)